MKRRLMLLAVAAWALVSAGSVFAYTLEQSGTGFAAISSDQFLTPPNSVHIGTVDTDDRAAIVFAGGPQLNSIGSFSYWVYPVARGTEDQLAPWAAIYLNVNPGCTYDSWITDYNNNPNDPNLFYIQAEPYYTTGDPVLDTWQEENAFGPNALMWESLEETEGPHTAPTLSQYISGAVTNYSSREYGSLYVCSIKIRMGYGSTWVDTEAYVDRINVDGALENFDPAPGPVPALSRIGLAALAVLLLLAGLLARRVGLKS